MKGRIGTMLSFGVFVLLIHSFLIPDRAAAQCSSTIGNYKLKSSARVTRTLFDFTYTADVTNSGPAVSNVQASLTSTISSTQVIDGSLSFGDVDANSTKTSLDTFTIRQDRLVPFDPAKL